jgi:murein DD-endopeptidase MepM/ murein hydrolase activator NlpD
MYYSLKRHMRRRRCFSGGLVWLAIILLLPGRAVLAQDTPGNPEAPQIAVHVVQPGETLPGIAALYGVTVEAIQQANGLEETDGIVVGQRLIIPQSGYGTAGTPGQEVVVGLADTMYTLAARYGIPVEDLAVMVKGVNPVGLYVGQQMWLPPLEPRSWQDEEVGLVRLGVDDALWRVALRSNSNLFELALRNHVANPVLVSPGHILVVPAGSVPEALLPDPWVDIVLHPTPLEQGRSGGLRITTTVPGTMYGSFLAADLNFVSNGASHEASYEASYEAVFGVNRWTEPGLYPLELSFEDGEGRVWTLNKQVLIVDGQYGREALRIPDEIAAVLNDPQAVQAEFSYVSQAMTGFSPDRYWDGLFLLPSPGVMTSGFGSVRSYNEGGYNSFHSGADLAAPTGTPVFAPAGGVVVDTGSLDVRGLVTFIDHGRGVFSGFWHQSSILVQPGDVVSAGQQIGTVGSTGLSTASHLHWEMWVAGVQVDPLQWVREQFP